MSALDCRHPASCLPAKDQKEEVREHSDYLAQVIERRCLRSGEAATIRPVRAGEGELLQAFVRSLSPRSRYQRFFSAINELPPSLLVHFTHIDYRRQMTLMAMIREAGKETTIGMAQYAAGRSEDACEFAIVVNDAWQRRGVGSVLLDSLMQCAVAASYRYMEGDVLNDNAVMLGMARSRGFEIRHDRENPGLMQIRTALASSPAFAAAPVSGSGIAAFAV